MKMNTKSEGVRNGDKVELATVITIDGFDVGSLREVHNLRTGEAQYTYDRTAELSWVHLTHQTNLMTTPNGAIVGSTILIATIPGDEVSAVIKHF